MSKWKDGQCPQYVWLEKETIGSKAGPGKSGIRLMLGDVKCWTVDPYHEPNEWVCYRMVTLVSNKGKLKSTKKKTLLSSSSRNKSR